MWPPQPTTAPTRGGGGSSIRLRAAIATEDDPKAVAVNAVTIPPAPKASVGRGSPRALSGEFSETIKHATPASPDAGASSCYTSSDHSDQGECSGSVWIVRHGERIDSVDKSWKTTAERPHDPPLTPLGIEQAAASGRALRGHRLDVIFTSPFLRCVQTALAIAEALGPDAPRIQVEPGLGEWLFNRWFKAQPVDGAMAVEALQRRHGAALASSHAPLWDSDERRAAMRQAGGGWEQPYQRLPFPESLPQVSNRYVSTLTALRDAAPYALLVTHGFGVQAMAEHASSDGSQIDEPGYCSLTRMRKLGAADWSCDLVCRSDHLAGAAPKRNGNGPMHTIAFSSSAF